MISVGTVEDWWEISRRYPNLRKDCIGFLKPIGYCFILDQVERLPGIKTILEFGHGFNENIFEELGGKYEVHGIDDYQALPYFPDEKGWEQNYSEYISHFPRCHFHRGLVGRGKNDLPSNYFDVVCSVSVLEELSPDVLADVLADAHRVLKPGGCFINSFDFMGGSTAVLNNYLRWQVEAGFDLENPGQSPVNLFRSGLAIEDQRTVMHWYYINEPDLERKWRGSNWHTLLTKAKALPSPGSSRQFTSQGAFPSVSFTPPQICQQVGLRSVIRSILGPELTAKIKAMLGR
jgi:SAM-dependent methyltransferase